MVAGAREHACGDGPHRRLVLDQQKRLPTAARTRRRGWLRRNRRLFGHAWQVDADVRAAARCAREPNVAAALLHDAVHRGETQAGALALWLGREERLEDVR